MTGLRPGRDVGARSFPFAPSAPKKLMAEIFRTELEYGWRQLGRPNEMRNGSPTTAFGVIEWFSHSNDAA
jgi:hypothetical protein